MRALTSYAPRYSANAAALEAHFDATSSRTLGVVDSYTVCGDDEDVVDYHPVAIEEDVGHPENCEAGWLASGLATKT